MRNVDFKVTLFFNVKYLENGGSLTCNFYRVTHYTLVRHALRQLCSIYYMSKVK